MSIMDTFRNAFSGPSAVPNNMNQAPGNIPNQPGNLPAIQNPIAANSPDGQLPGTAPQAQTDPMAEFQKLWEPAKPVDGAYVDSPVKFTIDPAKVNQSVKAIDFTKMVTPALMEKINAGGEGAMQATIQAMNEMAQNVMAQTMMANTKVLENGLELGHKRVEASLPGTIRKQTVSAALREDNPLFNNPATAPMLQMLETQLLQQFPHATTAEIKEHAKTYLAGFANTIKGQEPVPQAIQDARGREVDWSAIPIQ